MENTNNGEEVDHHIVGGKHQQWLKLILILLVENTNIGGTSPYVSFDKLVPNIDFYEFSSKTFVFLFKDLVMMDLKETKLELIEMLLTTENVSVLKKVKDLLLEAHDKNDESEVDYGMIEKRRQAHLNGESASYSWDEVKEKVRAAKL